MEVFGVGPAELVLILVIVLLIFGPDQLPEIAKKLGTGVRELRHTLDSISNEVDETVEPFKQAFELNSSASAAPPADSNLIVADEAKSMDDTLPAPEAKTEATDDTFPAPEPKTEATDETFPAPASAIEALANVLPEAETETADDTTCTREPRPDDFSEA